MSGTFLDTSQHADHFPDVMAVQEFTPGTLNNRGVAGPGTWADVEGLEELPCLVVLSKGEEVPAVEGGKEVVAVSTHEIIMQDYYPQIAAKMRGVIDGKSYEFLSVGHEGMKTVGLIKAKQVTSQ